MKNDRLFQLLYLLLEKRALTAPQLAQQLEVSVRTVYRDVEALCMAGIPVCTTAGKGGGISLMPGYTFDKAMLSDEEQNQVLFAIQSLQAADQPVDDLLAKLGSVFQKPDASWIQVDFSRWGMRRTDNALFEQLKTAILQRRVVELEYSGTSGETCLRQVLPARLMFKAKGWYLQAFCRKAQDYRLFKLGRISRLTLLDERFEQDLSDAPPLEMEAGPPFPIQNMTLRFAPEAAFRLYDELDRNCVERQPNGSYLARVAFPMDGWVYGYLLSFGTQVEILDPPGLRAQVAKLAKSIYEHHAE